MVIRFFNSIGAGVLTPDITYMAVSRKAAKDLLYLQHARTEKIFTDFASKTDLFFLEKCG